MMVNLHRNPTVLAALILPILLAGTPAIGDPFFMGLGDLPGGTFESRAYGISADGAFVVGSSQSVTGAQAFRWSLASGISGLGFLPGGSTSEAFDISDNGSVIVGRSASTPGMQAFRWTLAAGMFGLGDLTGGPYESRAAGVSGNGQVIVGTGRDGTSLRAYRWTSLGGMEALPMPPQGESVLPSSWGHATNSDGTFTVGANSHFDNLYAAVGWTTQGAQTSVQVISPQLLTAAVDVSADGSVVAGTRLLAPGPRTTRWTAQTGTVQIGNQPGFPEANFANGISADGSTIVGGTGQPQEPAGAYIWKSSYGMRMLSDVLVTDYGIDLAGWTLSEARAVSGDGSTIVGIGTNPSGNTEAWIAHIPEPTTLSLLMLAGVIVTSRRRVR